MANVSIQNPSINFQEWISSVENNLKYFTSIKKFSNMSHFLNLLEATLKHVRYYEIKIMKLKRNIHRFDIDSTILGNGFRSLDIILHRLFVEFHNFCQELETVRSSIFFLPGRYLAKLETYVRASEVLQFGLERFLKILDENDSDKPIFLIENYSAEDFINDAELVDSKAFYGQLQGFYLCPSLRRISCCAGALISSFNDFYNQDSFLLSRETSAMIKSVMYILYPEWRAQRVPLLVKNPSVKFIQAIGKIGEFRVLKELTKWICPSLEFYEEIWIPAIPINILNENGSTIQIQPPSSYKPSAPVRCILMSYIQRKGQIRTKSSSKVNCTPNAPLSPALLFHCHGGGFVSQTPESEEVFLRHWAKDLNIPILSVDYSLAPQAPFPRALEEVLLAYCWVLENPEKIGWTGERICFSGDSAGGNILMAVTIKTIDLNIRKPDAVLCAYAPMVLNATPCPSHMLCYIDTLCAYGFIINCLYAYIGEKEEYSEHVKNKEWFPEEFLTSKTTNAMKTVSKVTDPIGIESEKSNIKESFDTDDIGNTKSKQVSWEIASGIRKFNSIKEYILSFLLTNISYKKIARVQCELSLVEKLRRVRHTHMNPYMSPLFVSDDILKLMPQLYFLLLNFDPFLDGSVTLAKRLKEIGNPAVVDILDELPHGCLNLIFFSKEARNASDIIVKRIKEALKL